MKFQLPLAVSALPVAVPVPGEHSGCFRFKYKNYGPPFSNTPSRFRLHRPAGAQPARAQTSPLRWTPRVGTL